MTELDFRYLGITKGAVAHGKQYNNSQVFYIAAHGKSCTDYRRKF